MASVTEIAQFCFSPCFAEFDQDGNHIGECAHYPEVGDDPPPDQFEMHFYEDDHGLPGAELPDSVALEQPVQISAKAWWGGTYRCWDYAVDFDPPIGGFEIGKRYWVSLSGAGSPPPPDGTGCSVSIQSSLDGNGWAVYEHDHFGEIAWGINDVFRYYEDGSPLDFAYCIDGALEVPPTTIGACCECDSTCTDNASWGHCLGYMDLKYDSYEVIPPRGRFEYGKTCGEIVCEDLVGSPRPGENCSDSVIVGEGVHEFTNLCSTTDGPGTYVNCDNEDNVQVVGDIWYQYHACAEWSLVDIDLCNSAFDSVLAIYTNGTVVCPDECPPPEEFLVNGVCHDVDCPSNGATAQVCAEVEDQCFLIRVAGYAGSTAYLDPYHNMRTQGTGTIEIACGGCCPSSPAEPDTIVYPGDPPVALENQKMRYLSFSAGDPGKTQAVRVIFKDLPAPYNGWNGVEMWVKEPSTYCENSGKKLPPCPVAQPSSEFMGATLQCEPYYTDWSTFGTVHVYHEGIIPGGVYSIEVVGQSCDWVNDPDDSFSAPLVMTQSKWGDLVKSCAPCPCTPPDGVINMASDVTAVLDKFRNLGPPDVSCAPVTKARADHDWETPNQLVDISDATCCLDAFRGVPYPPPSFRPPSPPPCPP